ncbi:MAG: hypothetical protein KTU85_03480 [Acidimicrobiia bacterium]|nr:hypothetical protein [Acidimicrobiia bacterium]MCY4456549.1 hypothetical protein [Acidimicrobiaceae bacterium]
MIVVRVIIGVLGGLVALATLGSAIRTVVVPRGEQSFLANATVLSLRQVFNWVANRRGDWNKAEAVRARFAPVALMTFPFVWACGVILGCSGVFWALGVRPYQDAVVLSGSSLTTLGFRSTNDFPTLAVEIAEGIVGLGLVALLISFLPTIYAAFSKRETAVAKWDLRSMGVYSAVGPAAVLLRRHQVGSLDTMMHTWYEWEDWFAEIEESHTSFPILVYFRSQVPQRSWITCAGSVLDSASLYSSVLAVPTDPRAQLMIRTGTLSLRRICDYFGFEYDPDPSPDDPISITQAEFDDVYVQFQSSGMPVVADQQQAWRDFAGWRVNYDRPLLSLASWLGAPKATWCSDRPIEVRRPRIFHRLR